MVKTPSAALPTASSDNSNLVGMECAQRRFNFVQSIVVKTRHLSQIAEIEKGDDCSQELGMQEKSRCRALPSDTFEIGECNCFQTSPFEPSAVEVVASKDFEEKTDLL